MTRCSQSSPVWTQIQADMIPVRWWRDDEDETFYAVALPFNIIGSGATSYAAIQETMNLTQLYLECVLSDGPVTNLYFPAETELWEKPNGALFMACVQVNPRSPGWPIIHTLADAWSNSGTAYTITGVKLTSIILHGDHWESRGVSREAATT